MCKVVVVFVCICAVGDLLISDRGDGPMGRLGLRLVLVLGSRLG